MSVVNPVDLFTGKDKYKLQDHFKRKAKYTEWLRGYYNKYGKFPSQSKEV